MKHAHELGRFSVQKAFNHIDIQKLNFNIKSTKVFLFQQTFVGQNNERLSAHFRDNMI